MKRAVFSILLLAAAPAQAFEITGGSVELGYSGFTGNLLKKLDKTTLAGRIEVGFSPAFSMQADLGFMNFGFSDEEAHNIGLHGIYHASDITSLGMYLGQDRLDGDSLSIAGVEVGHQAGALGLEGYLTYAKDSTEDGIVFGARADWDFSDVAGIGLRYDSADLGGADVSRVALTGQYTLTSGLTLTGELGSAEIAGSGSEPFFGIGAKMTFGAERGATFADRSVLNLLPGL